MDPTYGIVQMRPVTPVRSERSWAILLLSSEEPEEEDCSPLLAAAQVEAPVAAQVPVLERPQEPARARVEPLRWPAELPPLAQEQAAPSRRSAQAQLQQPGAPGIPFHSA